MATTKQRVRQSVADTEMMRAPSLVASAGALLLRVRCMLGTYPAHAELCEDIREWEARVKASRRGSVPKSKPMVLPSDDPSDD